MSSCRFVSISHVRFMVIIHFVASKHEVIENAQRSSYKNSFMASGDNESKTSSLKKHLKITELSCSPMFQLL